VRFLFVRQLILSAGDFAGASLPGGESFWAARTYPAVSIVHTFSGGKLVADVFAGANLPGGELFRASSSCGHELTRRHDVFVREPTQRILRGHQLTRR